MWYVSRLLSVSLVRGEHLGKASIGLSDSWKFVSRSLESKLPRTLYHTTESTPNFFDTIHAAKMQKWGL